MLFQLSAIVVSVAELLLGAFGAAGPVVVLAVSKFHSELPPLFLART